MTDVHFRAAPRSTGGRSGCHRSCPASEGVKYTPRLLESRIALHHERLRHVERDHPPGGRLFTLVRRRHRPGPVGRERPGEGMHGHPPQRLRHLGEDAADPGPDVQGHRPRQRVLPALHPRELHEARGRARGGVRPGVRGGDSRRRQEARGAALRASHLGDDHLGHVPQVDHVLPRSAHPDQSVGQRGALGDAHAGSSCARPSSFGRRGTPPTPPRRRPTRRRCGCWTCTPPSPRSAWRCR